MDKIEELEDLLKYKGRKIESLEDDNNLFKYTGRYENDFKHGYGREEMMGTELAYEGEWSNNHFHGRGRLTRKNGTLEYLGEWSNSCVHGFGTIYNKEGFIEFQGNLVNDLPHGFGRRFDKYGRLIFEGHFSNGLKHGKGKVFDGDGNILYDGDFLNDEKNGYGILYDNKGKPVYKGNWNNGRKDRTNSKIKDNIENNEAVISDGEEITQENIMEKLHSLIGLNNVKKDVNDLVNYIKIKKLREQKGLKNPSVSFHLVFTGNPGTGKTTIARLISKLYKSIGLLSKGHLVEVDRSDLVAEYVGQTAPKVKKKIDEAKGGILFIDEAYSLVSGGSNDFGQEAINILLKEMEDKRDDLVVIVAGYKKPMEKFINSNPGLESRFNKYIDFQDYTVDELYQIFEFISNSSDYKIEDNGKEFLKESLKDIMNNKNENFGNGRFMRNLFEKMLLCHSTRIMEQFEESKEDIDIIDKFAYQDVVSGIELLTKKI